MINSPLQPAVLTVKAFDEASQLLIGNSSLDSQSVNLANAESKLGIQAVIDSGISCLRLIQTIDARWHKAIFEESIPYRESDREELSNLYQSWYTVTGNMLAKLGRLEEACLDLTDTVILQSGYAEVGGLLTPDDQFFEGEELDGLVQDAIMSLDRGETVEMREMGD